MRSVDGLRGCDYLANNSTITEMGQGMSVKEASVVLGNLIRVLIDLGYQDHNLQALTYDWRLSPRNLHDRDKKFHQMKSQIEILHLANREKVLLMGHSQGGKFIHYFLHWIADNAGRDWIDQHIEGMVGLGIPWTGAPKSLRTIVSGDSMGLPTFFLLGSGYMLSMSRTFSSVPWLFPLRYFQSPFYLKPAKKKSFEKSLCAYEQLNVDQLLLRADIPVCAFDSLDFSVIYPIIYFLSQNNILFFFIY